MLQQKWGVTRICLHMYIDIIIIHIVYTNHLKLEREDWPVMARNISYKSSVSQYGH